MANLYWYGGTGNWSDYTNHWSNNSGNSPASPASAAPTSSDNVFFDANSFTAGGQKITIDADANCLDMDWTGATNTPTLSGSISSSSFKLKVYGNLTFISAMVFTYKYLILYFSGSSITHNVTSNGLILTSGSWSQNTVVESFNTLSLQDDFKLASAATSYTINVQGTLTTNDKTLNASITSIGTLNLGSSTINSAGFSTSGAVNSGTSTINCIVNSSGFSFSGGGKTYNDVLINHSSNFTISGINTFNNLTIEETSSVKNTHVKLANDQTVTGTFTGLGQSTVNRISVRSSIVGTSRTLTANAVSLTNVNFQDIIQAGAVIPWTGTSVRYIPSNNGLVVNEWTSPTNVWISDDTRTSAGTGSTVDQQDYYRHNIPTFTGYSIDGIEVFVEAKDSAASPTTWTMTCRLSSDGGSVYTATKSQSWSSTTDTVSSFGGSADTWGRTWASSDLDTNNFLLDFQVTNGVSAASFSIDQITVQIYVSGGTTTSTSTSSTSSSTSSTSSSSSSSSTSSTSSSTSSTSSSSTSSTSSSTSSTSTSSTSSSTSSTSSSSSTSSTVTTISTSSTSSSSSSTSSTSSSTSSTSSSSSSTSHTTSSSSTSSTSSSTSSTSSSSSTSSTVTTISTSSTSSSTSSTSSSSSSSSTSTSTIMLKPTIDLILDQHPEYSESTYI